MRKITAVFLSVLLMLSALPVGAVETAKVRNTNHLDLVKRLGIMNPYLDNKPDETEITRGEFAAVLSRVQGLAWQEETGNPFADVDEQNPYYHQIVLMGKLGIMIGDEQNYFRPDAPVTFAQAAKCLIYILGYTHLAEKSGGYPSGYLAQASRLRISNGLENELDGTVSRGALAQMIYNSLDIVLLDVVTVGGKVEYSDAAGESILSKYFDMEKGTGVVNAVDGRSILTRSQISGEGYVQIEDDLYRYEESSVAELLGCRVEFYATGEDDDKRIVYMHAHEKNEELMIPVKDLETDSASFSLTNLCYTDRLGRSEEAQLADGLHFVYNGAFDYDFDLPDFNFDTGYVKLVDHNYDGLYDVALVWSFENIVVDSVGEELIRGRYNKSFKQDDDVTYRVLSSGGVWGGWELLKEASPWDVLSVAVAKDGSLKTIYVNRGGVAGTVNAVETDSPYKIEINGRTYTVSPQYLRQVRNSGYVEINAGLSSEFYLDIMGEIAAIYQTETDGERYGYLLGVMKKSAIDSAYQVKIYTQDGKTVVFQTKEKIKITTPNYDGKSVKCEAAFGEFYEGENFVQQLIRYSADDMGTLLSVEMACDATLIGYNTSRFSKDFSLTEEWRYQDATSTLGDKATYDKMFHMNAQTIIFYLPQDGGKTSEGNMNISDSGIFIGGKSYRDIEVYDCDDTYQASVLVYRPSLSGGTASTMEEYFFAVSGVFVGLNEEGDTVNKVRGMYRGAEQELEYISADGSAPEAGSIVRCEKKLSGELVISKANVVYSPTQTTAFYRNKTEALPLVWSQYGRLFRKNGKAITIYDGSAVPGANFLHTGYGIYKISKDKIAVATENDLQSSNGILNDDGTLTGEYDGTKIVANNRYQYVRELFIIEE